MRKWLISFVAAGLLLSMAAPAFAGGNDPANNAQAIQLGITPDTGWTSTTTYTAQVTGVPYRDGSTNQVIIYFAPEPKGEAGTPVATQSCSPVPGSKKDWTCTFTLTKQELYAHGQGSSISFYAAAYAVANNGAASENNEVAEDSNTAPIGNLPFNNLPEVPYAVVLPVVLLGVFAVSRRYRLRRS